ncbi:MAG: NUDIX domain-containing protein [Hyphomicrobiales bacterium]|nr:NUDIX domain-containing protein [Hyphomicrobiales bacterium]
MNHGPFTPSGRTDVELPLLAVYCVVLKGARLLLLKRTGTKYANGFWSVPAGHVDRGEPLLAAASRELEEETGLIVAPKAWSLLALMHRRTEERTVIDVFVKAEMFTGEPTNREPNKHGGLGFSSMADLPSPIVPYVARVVSLIEYHRDGRSPYVLEYGWE